MSIRLLNTSLTVLLAAACCCSVSAAPLPLPQPAVAQPIGASAPLTLGQAISIALAHLPAVDSAQANIDQALGAKQQAQSAYFPNLTAGYQFSNTTQQQFGIPVSPIIPLTENTAIQGGGTTVILNQTLLDSGARENKSGIARQGVYIAKANYDTERQQAILNVTQDYYALLLAQDLVTVAQSQVDRFQQAVDQTNAQIQAGTVAQAQIYQAQADLANARVTLVQNKNAVQTSVALLKNALGVESDSPIAISPLPAENGLPVLPPSPSVETMDDLVGIADKQRPDLSAQGHAVEEAQIVVREALQAAGITASATYAASDQATNDLGAKGLNTELLLTASYPLFDAGLNKGGIRIARAQLRSARDQYDTDRQQVRLEIEQSQANLDNAYQSAVLAQSAVKAAQVNVDAALAEEKLGVATTLDVTTAVATLTQSQNQYITAVYNVYSSQAQLEHATGTIDRGH